MRMSPELTTRRLRLVAFGPDDAGELHEMFADPRTHTIGGGPFTTIEQTERWLGRRRQHQDQHGFIWYGLRAHDSLIGDCGVFPGRTGPAEPEIGYLVHWPFRGRGYAAEAVAAVLAECRRAGLPRVWATVRATNTASRRIVECHGLRQVRAEDGLLFYAADLIPADRA